MENKDAIKLLKDKINQAKNVVVISGAGISAESGIPTFRGKDGLWKKYRAEELATNQAFVRDSSLVWEWYNWRREIIGSKKPNPAHEACVKLEKKLGKGFSIITQNVDGLHGLAGNKNVLEIHGNIWRTRCTSCGIVEEHREKLTTNPRCEKCEGLLRPDVVWFGESLDENILYNTFQKLLESEVALVVGTSGVVYPAAQFADTAKGRGAYVAEINLEKTAKSSDVDISIIGKAGEILPLLVD